MSDLPSRVRILEEGPREGFQIEKGAIPTRRKIELIDSLSETGVEQIQITSFVSPKAVPNMADAVEVAKGFSRKPGVRYTALWLNDKGLERAIATERLDIRGSLSLTASETFLKRNQNRTHDENVAAVKSMLGTYKYHKVPVNRASIMAAFGCNFEGDVSVTKVLDLVQQLLDLALEGGVTLELISLADTMAWATPASIHKVVGAVRNRYPGLELSLHLHDTRGMGIANAFAGLQMGVKTFDAAVAGLGGCPFASHSGASGNVCTEDLVFMCDEMSIETGINLEKMIESALLAEEIVGHPLPGSVMKGGSLGRLRQKVKARLAQ
ncbi:hydroxymethylglutaryl-CoA lyase [Jezberella montanilacus]|jgi:hydroxymethylglutaryl-CoA lyase|uniref:Hydroxymethylglutaryl-CoA lyase n=1 Tax=Jezberella montanilacus TaxID=323426 RepID=A0A2T0XJ40_9BURK|nr:hydroxymethylglutaryl-CoA lyase [Jezberella montanilacus]PRY98900.1 hydroxymethylglutaryl-CoA lyase [Jezberella montanilacus]